MSLSHYSDALQLLPSAGKHTLWVDVCFTTTVLSSVNILEYFTTICLKNSKHILLVDIVQRYVLKIIGAR